MNDAVSRLLDGAACAEPSLAAARGLHYGDGVFRTALVVDGAVHQGERALRILARDAARLRLELDLGSLAAEARALAAGRARAALKLVVWRRGAARGYRGGEPGTHRLLSVHPLPSWPRACWAQGVRVDRAPLSLAIQPRLAGIKHLNRLEQVLASQDWPEGIDERLLADTAGHAICGTRTNLFWVRGQTLHTSRLDGSGVAGAMREQVLEAASRSGIAVDVTPAALSTVLEADEVFLSNSLVGLWPVREFGARRWTAPGPVTVALRDATAHPAVHG